MKNLAMVAVSLWLCALGACGGKVIVDGIALDDGAGGSSSSSSSSNSSQNTSSATGPVLGCGVVAPTPGMLKECGIVGTTGTGQSGCGVQYCDPTGHVYQSVCKATTCICIVDGMEKCACSLDQGPGDFCAGTPPCCPWP